MLFLTTSLLLFVISFSARYAFVAPLSSTDLRENNEVLIAYKITSKCKQFIESVRLNGVAKTTEQSIPALDAIRSLIIPLIKRGDLGSRSVEFDESLVLDKSKYPSYDKLVVLHNGSPLGEFRWLKNIQLDRVILSSAVNKTKFEADVKSIPCVAFSEATPLRSVVSSVDYLRNQAQKKYAGYE